MIKSIGVSIGGIALVISLTASCAVLYSEQRLNSSKIEALEQDNRRLTTAVSNLNENQIKLVQTVSNQTEITRELKTDLKSVLKVLTNNSIMIAKIVQKVGANE